jgi:hypothetical protein
MKVYNYQTSRPIQGVCKQYAIWTREGNTSVPLIYFQRPSWIESDEAWEAIIDSIELNLPVGFQVE